MANQPLLRNGPRKLPNSAYRPMSKFFASDRGSLYFNALAGGGAFRSNVELSNIPLKLDSLGYISLAECICVSSTNFT